MLREKVPVEAAVLKVLVERISLGATVDGLIGSIAPVGDAFQTVGVLNGEVPKDRLADANL